MWKRALAVFSLCNLISPLLTAQTATKEPVPTIRTTAREVILDVIVRDKHHHAIADVRPEEIQVYEDGVKQKITAFRDVQGAEQLLTEQALAKSTAPAVSAGTTKGPSTALRELNFVSVVFAQIAPLNLEFAREAVLEFLKSGRLPNTYVTIYRLDRALQLIQPYTSDNAALVKAVGAAAKGVNTGSTVSPSVMAASAVETTVDANVANMTASPLVSTEYRDGPFVGEKCRLSRRFSYVGQRPGGAGANCKRTTLRRQSLQRHGFDGCSARTGTSSVQASGKKSRFVPGRRIDVAHGSSRRRGQCYRLRQSDGSRVLCCRYARSERRRPHGAIAG